MLYFVLIALIWIVVTVVGHASWMVLSVIFKAALGAETAQPTGPNLDDDVAATHRVLSLMSSRKLLDPDEVRVRRLEINGLKASVWKESQPTFTTPVQQEHVQQERSGSRQDFRPTQLEAATQTRHAARSLEAHREHEPNREHEPRREHEARREQELGQQAEPKLSLGESMAAFLADHNIRWGELLAGALIVVCSIGLVISLWETLTDTHRVIPSLIFMSGNAAIFGAGLYTFFRWRLPDTSRTMLLIAMLLVPLGILAGLSTGGIGTGAVLLTDPITLGAILLAAVIYGWMLWHASRALVGSRCALAMTIGVAGPAAVLPVVPAAIRTWGGYAGAVIGFASAALWLSQWLSLRKKGKGVFFGWGAGSWGVEAFVRQRAMLTVVSLFAFSVTVGYLAYMLREFGASWEITAMEATMTIAVAAMPGLVAFSAAAGSLSRSRRRVKIAFSGAVSAIGLGLACAALMIPALVSMSWLFAWGIVFSASALAAAWMFRSPRWTLLSSVPVGIAMVLSSPSFSGQALWESVPIWRRMIGGEPMLAAFSMGAATFLLRLMVRDRWHRRSAWIAIAGWCLYGVTNAAVLTIAPATLLGAVPVWLLPLALAFATLFVVITARRSPIEWVTKSQSDWVAAGLVSGLTFFFWVSVLKPYEIGLPFQGLKPLVETFAASSICLMLFAELLQGRVSVAKLCRIGAAAFITTAALLSIPLSGSFPDIAIAVVLLSTASLWWIAIRLSDALTMGGSRLMSVLAMLLIGHHGFGAWLTSAESCRNATALWGWSAATMGLAVFTYAQDALSSWIHTRAAVDSSRYATASSKWWDRSCVSRQAFWVAAFLAGLASMISYGTLVLWVFFEGNADRVIPEISMQFALPTSVLAGLLLAAIFESRIGGLWQRDSVSAQRLPIGLVFLSVLLWVGWQVGMRCFADGEMRLVAATSLAAVGCFAIGCMRRDDRFVMPWVGMVIVALSSIALMIGGWFPNVLEGSAPNVFATIAVALWWSMAAITSGWVGGRERSALPVSIASLIGTAIVVLVTPLWFPGQPWVWLQSAAMFALLLSFGLRILFSYGSTHERLKGWFDQSFEAAIKPSCFGLQYFGLWSGLSTCAAVVIGVLAGNDLLTRLHHPVGVMLSAFSVASLLFVVQDGRSKPGAWKRYWPIGISLLSGHAVMLSMPVATKTAVRFGWVGFDDSCLLSSLWILAASISLVSYWLCSIRDQKSDRPHMWHVASLVLGVLTVTWGLGGASIDFTLAFVASVIGVLLVAARTAISAWDVADVCDGFHRSVVATRLFAWLSLGAGVWAILGLGANQFSVMQLWTMVLMWIGSVTLIWRIVVPQMATGGKRKRVLSHRLADSEAATLVLLGLVVEALLVWAFPADVARLSVWQDSLLWCRLGMGGLVALSVTFRFRWVGMLEVGVLTVLASITLAAMRIATESFVGTEVSGPEVVAMVACLVSATGFSILVFRSSDACSLINGVASRWRGLVPAASVPPPMSVNELNQSLVRVSFLPIAASLMVCTWLLVACNGVWVSAVAVCGIASLAFAIGELGEQSGRVRLRDTAVTLGLTTVAMWASVNVVGERLPILALSTRWFVAWVLISVSLAIGLPRLLSEAAVLRWRQPIRRGVMVSLMLAVGSLLVTLGQEALVRVNAQTDLLDGVLVLGMAAVLALLSIVATFAGIVSGPGYSYREIWKLSDRQRSGLIVAAQVMGGLTWFHLFLCKNPLASLGLREYWPYVVMALAFASTGITEWARRRGDEVLQKTLMQTAFYLPLIPVIGFWLSGSLVTSFFGESTGGQWTYINGKVTYQTLLIAVAVYYGVISFLWKSGRTRVLSILFGNVALWVVLMQTPGWSFLAHPQAWLVPPALCALVATHFYQKSLGRDAANAIRYASTLVIYVTSTADMLIQGVGATLAGPIVLIVLALLGVAAGVALRVRPFLYLGATFVMLGLLSMVWHAQQQIDAVWPWWVFGITTGVLLLAGLMGIEKNKPKLKSMAASMSTWG